MGETDPECHSAVVCFGRFETNGTNQQAQYADISKVDRDLIWKMIKVFLAIYMLKCNASLKLCCMELTFTKSSTYKCRQNVRMCRKPRTPRTEGWSLADLRQGLVSHYNEGLQSFLSPFFPLSLTSKPTFIHSLSSRSIPIPAVGLGERIRSLSQTYFGSF